MLFKPSFSDKEIVKIKKFHELVVNRRKKIKKKKTIKILGRNWIILPGISDSAGLDSQLLGKAVLKRIKKGQDVLDMGCGCGIQGILAAEKGAEVTLVDFNPKAIKCSLMNIRLHYGESSAKAIHGSLFEKINGKFDYVIINPPFRWFKPKNYLEAAGTDFNYAVLTEFFSQVRNFLRPKGRILMVFSTNGDWNFVKELIKKKKFGIKMLSSTRNKEYGWKYFVIELSKN